MAMMELEKLVPEVLRNFEISFFTPEQEWETKNSLFVQQKGLICTMKRRT